MKFFATIQKLVGGAQIRGARLCEPQQLDLQQKTLRVTDPCSIFKSACRQMVLAFMLASSFRALAGGETNVIVPDPAPATARDFYNAGTKLLVAKKFADAEKMFQSALAAQDERVQPAALYNVAQARFYGGLERLKKGPDQQKAVDQGNTALTEGERAIHQSESALAANNINDMINAYIEGRGARHD